MPQPEARTAEHNPNGRSATKALRATLTPSAEPEGASMLVGAIFEDLPPCELDGTEVDERAVEHWDFTDDYDVHHLDDPPVCDRGPNLYEGDL